MAIRKNVRRIDPRYFLNEKRELTKEEIQKAIKEIAEEDPSEWGQNISSYFDELDAYRKLSRVLEIGEEDLQNTMEQMGLSIIPAETMAASEEEIEDVRYANRAPEYEDEMPPLEEIKKLPEAKKVGGLAQRSQAARVTAASNLAARKKKLEQVKDPVAGAQLVIQQINSMAEGAYKDPKQAEVYRSKVFAALRKMLPKDVQET